MKRINLNTKRLEILKDAKKHLIFNGWNDNIFKKIVKERKYKEEEMRALFPKGYRSILELYLSNVDQEMTEACKKIDFIRMRTHERVGEIILMRLKNGRMKTHIHGEILVLYQVEFHYFNNELQI